MKHRSEQTHFNLDGRPKVGYRNRAKAEQAAATIRKIDGEDLTFYRCRTCRDFHIGHRICVWTEET